MSERGPRWLALQLGEKMYSSGVPCKRGHLANRIAATGSCTACRRLLENERYAANPDFFRKTALKYARKHKIKLAVKASVSRANETPEQREARLATSRIRSMVWRMANPKHANTKKVKQAWKVSNPGKVNAHGAKRRAALLQRTPVWLTEDDLWLMEQAYDLANLRTKMFGFAWHVDHIVPLQGKTVSGLHVPINLQVIPGSNNIRKANSFSESCLQRG